MERCKHAAEEHPQAKLLMTQPGVGPNTALAFVLTIGEVSRFQRGKQVASYVGLIPREESSGGRQKLGAISKQGNRLLRSLLVEAAQVAVRYDPQFRKQYLHRCHQKPKAVAKVAAARKLAVRLYWMLRTQRPYPEIVRIESSPRVPLVGRARPKELIGRSRIPHRRDVRIAESWPSVRSNRWLVERFHRRVIQVRFPESWSSTFSGKASGAQDISVLTTPSLLSR